MTLVRWQPRQQMHWNLQREMDRRMHYALQHRWANSEDRDWMPAVDVEERENEYAVSVDIPGVDKKDVKVSVEGNVLTIKGERKYERTEDEDGTCYCSERRFGTFSRSFSLSKKIDTGKITAKHKDGVLTVTLLKAEEAKEREIEIQVK
ncbi:Hsp20/alpha crystallin family protein [Candidatus Zixiibacteriota bacterium]